MKITDKMRLDFATKYPDFVLQTKRYLGAGEYRISWGPLFNSGHTTIRQAIDAAIRAGRNKI